MQVKGIAQPVATYLVGLKPDAEQAGTEHLRLELDAETNDPTTIGKHVSSGCIRLTNEDVEDLYNRVQIGAKVVVLPQTAPATIAQMPAAPEQASSYAPAVAPFENKRAPFSYQ